VSRSDLARAGGAVLLRYSLLALAGLGVLGAAVDLALARHWQSPIQLIPWAALGVLTLALGLIALRPTSRNLWIARGLGLLVAAAAGWGVYEHVAANYNTAPLDFRYADRWEAMTAVQRLWAAGSQAVGPSPTLAPGLLGYLALATGLATLVHPVRLGAREDPPEAVATAGGAGAHTGG
jgi:hypothetical protein